MLFSSLSYLLFLPLVYLFFILLGPRARWGVLVVSSFVFYAALKEPFLLGILGLVIAFTYAISIWMRDSLAQKGKLSLYWCGVGGNVFILAFAKYLPLLKISLPLGLSASTGVVVIGVSYFTFQAISYLTDIYFEVEEPERHLGYFALYMAFFPKLLQGPIERASDLLPQLKQPFVLKYDNVRAGLLMLAWGLFKKAVVADRLSLYVNPVYDNVHSYSGPVFIFITYLYAFQLYFDFSGYTDMALGSARIFNIRLTQNFNRPYLATSVADFWRRWHISFSRWILDYIFKPVQFYLRTWKKTGTAVALLVTFLISGVWHGATWGFLVWGLLHGVFMASSVLTAPLQKRFFKATRLENTALLRVLKVTVTFHLVCFCWVFFRSNSLADAVYIIRSSVSYRDVTTLGSGIFSHGLIVGNELYTTAATFICSLLAIIASTVIADVPERLGQSPRLVRYLACYGLVFLVIAFGVYDNNKFIYFKF